MNEICHIIWCITVWELTALVRLSPRHEPAWRIWWNIYFFYVNIRFLFVWVRENFGDWGTNARVPQIQSLWIRFPCRYLSTFSMSFFLLAAPSFFEHANSVRLFLLPIYTFLCSLLPRQNNFAERHSRRIIHYHYVYIFLNALAVNYTL